MILAMEAIVIPYQFILFGNAPVVWEVMLFLECIDYVDAELTQSIRSKFPIY